MIYVLKYKSTVIIVPEFVNAGTYEFILSYVKTQFNVSPIVNINGVDFNLRDDLSEIQGIITIGEDRTIKINHVLSVDASIANTYQIKTFKLNYEKSNSFNLLANNILKTVKFFEKKEFDSPYYCPPKVLSLVDNEIKYPNIQSILDAFCFVAFDVELLNDNDAYVKINDEFVYYRKDKNVLFHDSPTIIHTTNSNIKIHANNVNIINIISSRILIYGNMKNDEFSILEYGKYYYTNQSNKIYNLGLIDKILLSIDYFGDLNNELYNVKINDKIIGNMTEKDSFSFKSNYIEYKFNQISQDGRYNPERFIVSELINNFESQSLVTESYIPKVFGEDIVSYGLYYVSDSYSVSSIENAGHLRYAKKYTYKNIEYTTIFDVKGYMDYQVQSYSMTNDKGIVTALSKEVIPLNMMFKAWYIKDSLFNNLRDKTINLSISVFNAKKNYVEDAGSIIKNSSMLFAIPISNDYLLNPSSMRWDDIPESIYNQFSSLAKNVDYWNGNLTVSQVIEFYSNVLKDNSKYLKNVIENIIEIPLDQDYISVNIPASKYILIHAVYIDEKFIIERNEITPDNNYFSEVDDSMFDYVSDDHACRGETYQFNVNANNIKYDQLKNATFIKSIKIKGNDDNIYDEVNLLNLAVKSDVSKNGNLVISFDDNKSYSKNNTFELKEKTWESLENISLRIDRA